MSLEKEKFIIIEDYLNGRLRGEALIQFEAALNTNTELQEEVDAHRVAEEMVMDYGLLQLKQKMINEYRQPSSVSKKVQWKKYYKATAATVLIGALGISYYLNQSSNSDQDIPDNTSTQVLEPVKKKEQFSETVERTAPEKIIKKQEGFSGKNKVIDQEIEREQASESKNIEMLSIPDKNKKEHEKNIRPIYQPKTPELINPRASAENLASNALDKPIPEKKIMDCAAISLKAVETTTVATCKGSREGRIFIKGVNIESGTIPYEYSIDEGKHFQKTTVFEGLEEGDYQLSIKDGQGCTFLWSDTIAIEGKQCNKTHAYTFYPEQGELWKFPIDAGKSGEIRIFNRGGLMVFETTINSGYPEAWAGRDRSGGYLRMGVYSFVFIDTEGSTINGTINLLR